MAEALRNRAAHRLDPVLTVRLKVKGPKKPSRGTIGNDADLLAGNLRWSYGLVEVSEIQRRIISVRSVQVMLDRDLAKLYGVELKALNTVFTALAAGEMRGGSGGESVLYQVYVSYTQIVV